MHFELSRVPTLLRSRTTRDRREVPLDVETGAGPNDGHRGTATDGEHPCDLNEYISKLTCCVAEVTIRLCLYAWQLFLFLTGSL